MRNFDELQSVREACLFGRAVLPLVVAATLLGGAPAVAAQAADDVDPLALAAVLLDGGHADRAEKVLASVDPAAKGVDVARLYTLRGLVGLRQERFEASAADLARAVKLSNPADPALFLYLAKARFGAGDHQGALRALDDAGPRAKEDPQLRWLRAECLLATGRDGEALTELRLASDRFPRARYLREREVRLLVEKQLFEEASERARPLVLDGERDEVLRLLDSLRRAGATKTASLIGEEARLRFAYDPEVMVAVGHVEADAGRPLAAARLLEDAARYDPRWAADAAELYRRAGRTRDALRVGAAVLDVDKKVRQRFGILLENQRFEEAASLEPRLARLGLLEEGEVAYGLAYALFRIGRLDAAERILGRVEEPALFRTRTELAQAIAACRTEEWRCH